VIVNDAIVVPPALDAVQVSVDVPVWTVAPLRIEHSTGTLDVGAVKSTTAPFSLVAGTVIFAGTPEITGTAGSGASMSTVSVAAVEDTSPPPEYVTDKSHSPYPERVTVHDAEVCEPPTLLVHW
jgi:hypothetical protein